MNELQLLPRPRHTNWARSTFTDASAMPDHEQGYSLTIVDGDVTMMARTDVGRFYARQTLDQLRQLTDGKLPDVQIRDWPDFANRGVMLDISRDKVPTMETLYDLIDMLATWKINQFQLYTEHTFAYEGHEAAWKNASPMTAAQIRDLDAYCQARFIDLVPNQNSFGHLRRWLVLDEYKHLAEAPDGCETIWGWFDEPFTLDPTAPGSLELLRDWYDQLLPNFSSAYFNVGFDETVDLGKDRSKALADEIGVGRLYLNFLHKVHAEVSARGRTMQFWGDIIINHPELVPELPKDAIAMEWGYEANHPFDEHGALFAQSGIPYYVCAGTSSWNSIAGRTKNALANLLNAAENGLKHGAIGFLNTDWGDNGHWQPLPASYIPYVYGAAVSWCLDSNREIDVAQAASQWAFADPSGTMGAIAYEMGAVSDHIEIAEFTFNNAALFVFAETYTWTGKLVKDMLDKIPPARLAAQLKAAHDAAEQLEQRIDTVTMARPDADLIKQEYRWAAVMLRHLALRGLWRLEEVAPDVLEAQAADLLTEYKAVWHGRNRPGGYTDSVARMEKMMAAYHKPQAKS